ncbi:MAG TPA: hypothetical protein PL004_02595 [Bacillota bacterium]|nr:hypothetical protein [Bacillota bacterium]
MCAVREEKGIAFVLVLFALVMFGVTSIVVMTGVRTQGNVTSMMEGSKLALLRAEDGLTIAIAKIKDNQSFGSSFEYTTADNWRVRIEQSVNQNGSTLLRSTATRGRFSRTVAVDYDAGNNGPHPALQHAIFAYGDIELVNGWMNLNGNSVFTNSNMTISRNFGGDGGGSGELLAHGTITHNGTINNTPIRGGQDEIPFPELDFEKLTAGQRKIPQSQLLSTLQTMQDTGGTIVVEVNSPEVKIDRNITLNRETTIIFVKAPGYTGDYVVHFKADSWNINGKVNFLADGGTYHFNNFSYNSKGIIYSNYESPDGYTIHVNNSNKAFDIGGLIVKGKIKLDNANVNLHRLSDKERWDFLDAFLQQNGFTYKNWREL